MLEVARLTAGLGGEDILKTLGLPIPFSLKTWIIQTYTHYNKNAFFCNFEMDRSLTSLTGVLFRTSAVVSWTFKIQY